jgi:hypothetical protein
MNSKAEGATWHVPIVGIVVTTGNKNRKIRKVGSEAQLELQSRLIRNIINCIVLTFSKLELVKDCRFTGSIKTDHQDPHLFLAELLETQESLQRRRQEVRHSIVPWLGVEVGDSAFALMREKVLLAEANT